MFNTYRCLSLKLLLKFFDVARQLGPCHARRVSKAVWEWKGSEICSKVYKP